ncbi:MAG: SpoIIE family protein phosphatase [Leptospiraceae bacterium]|nr:SpoIIE family protein phosphatase [Leptospiraceae bacterium]MCZ8345670.1 SpoIIE family protein phosphatase [Leptospiraceae bacterium]
MNLKKILSFLKPGIRIKLIVFTLLLLITFGLANFAYFYYSQKEWISDNFQKEIEAPLSYINSLSLEMENIATTLILVEDMKNRIKTKGNDKSLKRKVVSSSISKSLFGLFSQKNSNVSYQNTYYSQYLPEKEILALTERIQSQFRDEKGVIISDQKFKGILSIAGSIAKIQARIEDLESKIEKSPKEEKVLIREKGLLSKENKRFREIIQNFFKNSNRDKVEELGFNPRNVRIQSYDIEKNLFLDTGKLIQGSSFSSRRLFSQANFENDKKEFLNFEQNELVHLSEAKTKSYEIGKNLYDVISKPFFKSPSLTNRSTLILADMNTGDSNWMELIREDRTLTIEFEDLIDKLRDRRATLASENILPNKDKEYNQLYKEYNQLLKKRSDLFTKLHPYPDENKNRRETINLSIDELEKKAKDLENKISSLHSESKLANSKGEESLAEKLELQAENLGSDLSNTNEEIEQLKNTITSWNEYPKLKLAESYQNLRDASLKAYIHLPYKNDTLSYDKFLRDNSIFNSEHRRWKHIRDWITDASSETSLPKIFIPGRGRVETFEDGILSRSRMEAEDYMWFLDSTPIYSYPDIEKSLAHILLSKNLAGVNLIIIDRSDAVKKSKESINKLLQVSLGLAAIFMIIAIVSSNYAVKKLRKITESTEKIGEGDLNVEFPSSGWDEIGSLGRTLNSMVKGLREREELRGELEAAEEIQKRLLPDKLPIHPGLEFGAFYKAMHGVGGDYFDFIEMDGKIFLCVGDVSNHGVGPALVMALLRSQLHTLIRKGAKDPKKILLELNSFLYADTPDTIFVTFFLGVYDLQNHEIIFASAGHNKPIVYRKKDDTCKYLKAGGLPLGMDENSFFETTIELRKTSLEPGDFFFQYTDGVNEAMNESREQYGNERLATFLKKNQSIPSNELVESIARDVETFSGKKIFIDGPSELNDDIAMIGIKRIN